VREGRLSSELRIVHELAERVGSSSYDLGEMLESICSHVRRSFHFQRALLVRLNLEERTVHAVVRQGVVWPGDQWLLLEKFPFLTRALEAGRAVFVKDARREAALPSALIKRFGVHSIVGVPLVVEGRCLGFIVGDRREGGGQFDLSEQELEFLTTLGTIAAVFIARADQYQELQSALDELRRLDEAKDQFISIASHELRTPISVVHGIAATLQHHGPKLAAEQILELRQTLYEQTARLRELAEQLLDLSKIDAGAVVLALERFRPRERLEELLPRIVPERLEDVELAVEPTMEVESDPNAFERIMANLVVNAVQYGRPPVAIRAEDNGTAQILVEDEGDGVDPEFVPRLFERFARSSSSWEHKKDGAGLGLAIAQAYARALGGDLSYEPREPRGSRFKLELPSS
jgi:signal transduction histidine kinase